MAVLSQSQFEAVYKAMTELNNVGGLLHARILVNDDGKVTHIKEFMTGEINVWLGDASGNCFGTMERYANQAEFQESHGG